MGALARQRGEEMNQGECRHRERGGIYTLNWIVKLRYNGEAKCAIPPRSAVAAPHVAAP